MHKILLRVAREFGIIDLLEDFEFALASYIKPRGKIVGIIQCATNVVLNFFSNINSKQGIAGDMLYRFDSSTHSWLARKCLFRDIMLLNLFTH